MTDEVPEASEVIAGLPVELPSISDKLAQWLGFKLPVLHLPQTLRNFDKALSRLVGAVGENWASHLDEGTAVRKAKITARANLIAAASKLVAQDVRSGGGSFEQRAIAHAFGEEFLKQSNREKIVHIAAEQLATDATDSAADATEEISDDWLNEFSSAAGNKSNEDIQILWGKMLAGKIREPKSFSVHSLRLLANFSADDARAAHKMLGRTLMDEFIAAQESGDNVSDFLICEELGVLTGAGGTLSTNFPMPAALSYVSGTTGIFAIDCKQSRNVSLGAYPLTRFGRDLLRLSTEYEVPQTYIHEVIKLLKGGSADIVTFSPGRSMP